MFVPWSAEDPAKEEESADESPDAVEVAVIIESRIRRVLTVFGGIIEALRSRGRW